MKRILFFLIAFTVVFACSQWKVNSIKSTAIAEIKNGTTPGNIQIARDEYALNDLTFKIDILNDKIITTDNTLKRLQVFEKDGKLQMVIGETDKIDRTKIHAVDFNFSILGSCTMDDNNNIYVQNRLEPKKGKNGYSDANFLPSYILVFDKKGQLQYTLGRTGTPDIPFFYIDNLFVDSSDRLFVISRTFNNWELYRFRNKQREVYIDFSKIDFKENEGNNTYLGKIENLKVYRSGDSIVLSVAYYHDLRFKFRKIYEFSVEKKKVVREITTIPDPKNVLFNIVDDKTIYFWNIDGNDIKFMIVNAEGNVMNNIRLTFDNRNFFSKIIHDNKGNIYSYHVNGDSIKILEWE